MHTCVKMRHEYRERTGLVVTGRNGDALGVVVDDSLTTSGRCTTTLNLLKSCGRPNTNCNESRLEMSPVEMALFLSAIVITVLVATRPVPTRRRPAPPTRTRNNRTGITGRVNQRGPLPRRKRRSDLSPDNSQRNHWDRADMAVAVGRDHAHPDVTLTLWP